MVLRFKPGDLALVVCDVDGMGQTGQICEILRIIPEVWKHDMSDPFSFRGKDYVVRIGDEWHWRCADRELAPLPGSQQFEGELAEYSVESESEAII